MGLACAARPAVLALILALAACSGPRAVEDPVGSSAPGPATSPTRSAAPTAASPSGQPTTAAPTPSRKRSTPDSPQPSGLDSWDLGGRVLPLRPDGYGESRPTPAELRVRRMPTVDRLPPPPDGRFVGSVGPITPAVRKRMGTSWQPGCPVRLADLRYLRLTFHGFDGRAHTGELVVHADHARKVLGVFQTLYEARYPIEQMDLPSTAERDRTPSGDGNNTSALVCRAAVGQTRYSAHAYGLAIDLNPFHNPYRRGDLVLPELAGAYLDRSWRRPGMIREGDVVVRAFARIGWSWGGGWRSLKDYHHFTATGR